MRNPFKNTPIKSVRWKLMIMYIALVFIVMIISGTFMIVMIRGDADTKARQELEAFTKIYEEIINNISDDEIYSESIQDIFENSYTEYQINLINAKTRTTLFSNNSYSNSLNEKGNEKYSSSVIVSALGGEASFNSGRTYADVNGTMKPWMEYAKPIKGDDNEVKYVIYTRMNATSIFKSISQTTNTFAMAICVALFFTGVLGILFSSTITEPIIALTKGAKDLASGKQDKKIPVLLDDEIGQLTKSFNNMADELNQTMVNMENEKNKLEIVLYNMTDGVLAYDENGKVLHYNHVCKELLDFDGELGNIDDYNFSEMKEKLKITQEAGIDVIEPQIISIGDKYINATFNTYYKKVGGDVGGVIIVLQDITKRMKLENMRKEFVANVSHEIRTPLTSVKSYTETLLDGALDDRNVAVEFLNIINSEADRMTLLVKDLLELSKMDSSQMDFDMKIIDLTELVAANVSHHIMIAKRQNKNMEFVKYPDKLYVEADAERINQVLNNIITNSLKYSSEGASVRIWLETGSFHHKVYVKDNGMGIPKEDLRRIFERFYRVDKARSRELGGTGLGLSIAQEIMESHGGKITAISELGKGTTMIIRFPIANPDKAHENEES